MLTFRALCLGGAVALGIYALAGCSASQVATVQADTAAANQILTGACADATAAANLALASTKGGAAGTAASIANGVLVGCVTAEGFAKLAADPSSTQWLGIQQGNLQALTAASAKPSQESKPAA